MKYLLDTNIISELMKPAPDPDVVDWVNEHDAGMLADVKIILNIDMFEHAYIKDFGTKI